MPNHQPTILIVDDEAPICEILKKMLKREGYQPTVATSSSQALARFEAADFDLVLLDLMMPEVSGLELATKFLEQKSLIPIILFSAFGTVPRAVEATKIGVYDFLEKPLDRDRILVTVRNALALGKLEQELAQYKQENLQRFKMIGQSGEMKRIYNLIERIAPTNSSVLISGENGTGKELVATAIHAGSKRSNRQSVKINCAAVPATILESELFGHTKGAFTGALSAKKGRLETADNGTLFLDEIGDMDEMMQVKLLRFLESGEIQKVGSTETIKVNVRLLAATNHNLLQEVQKSKFREDLYYRINVVHIHVPALRERRSDIPLLTGHFLAEFAESLGVPEPRLTPAASRFLKYHNWPGNIRQLRNFIERILVINYSQIIDLEHVKPFLDVPEDRIISASSAHTTLHEARRQFERQFILNALQENNGSVSRAAKILGLDRANLYRKMHGLGIDWGAC